MASFLIIQSGSHSGQRLALDENVVTTLGRNSDNLIRLEAPFVSLYEGVIRYHNNQFVLIDLGSEVPVLVRGMPLEPGAAYVLQPQDLFEIGSYVFRFQTLGFTMPTTTIVPKASFETQPGLGVVMARQSFSARRFFDERRSFLQDNDLNGLLQAHYQPDAVLLGPGFGVSGLPALRDKLTAALTGLQFKRLDNFTQAENSIFFEATYNSSVGETSQFEAWVLRDNKIAYDFVGLKIASD